MRVKVVFLQEFYEYLGRFEIEAELPEGATVRDLIDYIDRGVKPGFKKLVVADDSSIKYPVEIMVNGRRIDFLQGLGTVLRDGDKVVFSPRALFVV